MRQKYKQMLSKTLSLNFCYLKIIHILHPHYRPKLIGYTLKTWQRSMLCLYSRDYTINLDENEDENEK